MKSLKSKKLFVPLGCGIAFILLQFIQPEKTNPASDPAMALQPGEHVPHEVYASIQRACFDCHSNTTAWPWYSHLSPVNLLLVYDVTQGRAHLNFSDWKNKNPRLLADWLEYISREVGTKRMPFILYRPLHPDASLSDADRIMIVNWAKAEEERYRTFTE
jgi:hypothetical protein